EPLQSARILGSTPVQQPLQLLIQTRCRLRTLSHVRTLARLALDIVTVAGPESGPQGVYGRTGAVDAPGPTGAKMDPHPRGPREITRLDLRGDWLPVASVIFRGGVGVPGKSRVLICGETGCQWQA